MRTFQRESILSDEQLSVEIARRLAPADGAMLPGRIRAPLPAPPVHDRAVEAIRGSFDGGRGEAIVRRLGRPTLLVRNDTFEVPPTDTWRARLHPTKSKLDAAIRSVGRVEVVGSGLPYIGTAWMIADGVAVTNRHVALEFARKKDREFVFRANPFGQVLQPHLDFKEEHAQLTAFEAQVEEVLFIAGLDDNDPDLAFLALAPPPGRLLPPPIPLFDGEPERGQTIAVIGYPAEDPRNDVADQARLFGGIFDVKRLAPGEVMARIDGGRFTHDCTTLGGSSGSVIVDVATGAALGLHFAGEFLEANFAVDAATLRRFLTEAHRSPVVIDPAVVATAEPEVRVPLSQVEGRRGYSETFLGTDALAVPLPTLSDGQADNVAMLPYTHFSVAAHAPRRMALFTAVNIDGDKTHKIKRGRDTWSFDPRLVEDSQCGNFLYANNDLDRGHLVRRLDPAWGSKPDAEQAERDTFFFTNSTPQHAQFNQRLWLELEDYLLDHADTLDFKACVFTGPVFDDDDKAYRGIQLPEAYWKVAVMVHAERQALSATAYVVSQADLISNIEFVFGQVKTYQVPIARVEALTGLGFGPLKDFDPLRQQEALAAFEINASEDVRL
ncbi:MAG: DNA/RNA non-specific endonuclease [Acidimicrobiales bacterium]